MTKKGNEIVDRILEFLERNPDGLRVGQIQNLVGYSRNSLYRYLNELFEQGKIRKTSDKVWKLTEPIKPQTILGYQYQALLQGLKEIGGKLWDIEAQEGRNNFKALGKFIYPKMKMSAIDVVVLKSKNHHLEEIIRYILKLVDEASTVEHYVYHPKLDEEGFPDPTTHLAAIVTLEGGYVSSDPVAGNGFSHYYIIAGIIEASADRIIPPIYGGRIIVDVLKTDEDRQMVDIGFYVIFDKQTPFIDPKTKMKIANPYERTYSGGK